MIEAAIQLSDQEEIQTVHQEWDRDEGKLAGADFTIRPNTFETALKREMGR